MADYADLAPGCAKRVTRQNHRPRDPIWSERQLDPPVDTSPEPSSQALDDQRIVDAQVRVMVEQSRVGLAVVPILGMLLGFTFQPAVGWGPYLAWYTFLVAFFFWRARLFERFLAEQNTRPSFARAAFLTSVFLGFVVSASAPLFFHALSGQQRAFLTGILCAWCAASSTILGAYPRCYKYYVLTFVINLGAVWEIGRAHV